MTLAIFWDEVYTEIGIADCEVYAMFKYYLNLNNDMTVDGHFEVHKKNCPIINQFLGDGDDRLLILGFFRTPMEAMAAAKEALAARGLDPNKASGCLTCNSESHER